MPRHSRLILFWTLPIFLAVTAATILPLPFVDMAPGGDKLHHMIAFGMLCLPTALIRPRWAIWAVVATIAYGGFIEIVQPYVGRMRELADLRADAIGAVCGALAGVAVNRLFMARRTAAV